MQQDPTTPAHEAPGLAVLMRRAAAAAGAEAAMVLLVDGERPCVVGAWPRRPTHALDARARHLLGYLVQASGSTRDGDLSLHELPTESEPRLFLALHGPQGPVDPGSVPLSLSSELARQAAAQWNRRALERARELLLHRREFERLVMEIAIGMAGVGPLLIDHEVNRALARIGAFVGADRAYLFRIRAERMSNTHEWCAEGIEPEIQVLQDLPLAAFAPVIDPMRDGSPLHIPVVEEVEHERTRALLEEQGIQSLVLVPLTVGGQLRGYVGFDAVKARRVWDEEAVELLRIVGTTLANTFERIDAEREAAEVARAYEERLVAEVRERTTELRESEARFRGLADNMPNPVLTFTDKVVRYANPAANDLAGEDLSGLTAEDIIRLLNPSATGMLDQVQARGVYIRRAIRIETPGGTRFLDLQMSPLASEEVLLTALDITEQRRADAVERDHLTQVDQRSRAVGLAELASSLGHELNQPLMAVQAYAEGSVRVIEAGSSPMEVLDAMRRASEEATRAGEIVLRLRSLFRRDRVHHRALRLDELVSRTARLFEFESARLRVEMSTALEPDTPPVSADARQLEVVLLNLIRNAMSALEDAPRRCLTLGTCTPREGQVALFVRDTGRPIVPQAAARMFDSFFTTRKDGSGMGLFISRTIAESHGGDLWYEVEEDGAKTFYLALPVAG